MSECEHCGSTDPGHTHRDTAALDARRAALGRWSAAMVGVLAGTTGATVAALSTTGVPLAALGLVLGGALAWAGATAGGVLAVGLTQGPRGERPLPPAAGFAVGALATAALTPVAALAVALVARSLDVPPWSAAVCAGVGWLLAGGVAFVVATTRLRADLLAPGSRGDQARSVAARATRRGDLRAFLAVVGTAVVAAVWVGVLQSLPLLVLVLVPLHVAVAALTVRSGLAARRDAAGATLPG